VASTIKIKRSGVANKTPTTADIATGELAINYKDQKLFSSNGTAVFQIGASSGSGLVSITTATVKNLTQNDTVVTNVGVVAANDYLQVANAVATYLTKNNPVVTGTLTANGSTGTSGYYLRTSGTGVYWSPASSGSSGATWAALTGTNTALRTLISDRLQVANAAATYQTKTVERAALANTNLRVNLINTNLTGTNTALRTLISDRLQVANASTLYATKSNPTTSGLLAHTGRATISTNLNVSGNTIISGTLVANSTAGTAGYYLRTSGTGVYWSPVSASGGGSSANGFSGILVGANVVVAATTTTRLSLIAGSGISLAANPTTKAITIATNVSAAANVVTKTLNSLLGTDTVVTSVSGIVAGSSPVGNGTDRVFYENDTVITTNYTITTNKNAMTAGPVTINSGVTVTIPSGSVWSII
jgi:hypothetical protein